MDSIKAKKSNLRKQHIKLRNDMKISDISLKSQLICNSIIETNEYQKAEQLFCFYPLGNEVDIIALIKQGLDDQKIVCFPKVMSKTTIKFYRVKSLDEFKVGNFNVMEPVSNEEVFIKEHSLMIVPGLAFDNQGNRLGYGGGYYDRYLDQDTNHYLHKIGVCYDWQKIKDVPVDEFDKKLNRTISELY